jgi:streptogramin lyase
MARDKDGNVYTTETSCGGAGCSLRKITPAGLVTVVATNPTGFGGVAIDKDGVLYYSTSAFNTPSVIYRLTATGSTVVAGGTTHGCTSIDGVGADAALCNANGLVFDSAGNLIVAGSASGPIRKVTPAGQVTTIVDAGVCGYQQGYIAIDPSDAIYVTESSGTVRRFTPPSWTTSIIGNLGYDATLDEHRTDGTGNTGVREVYGIQYTDAGLFVTDFGYNVSRVVKVQ